MALTPSLNPYGTNNIATGLIVQAPHVYQFVYALAGTEAYNILISGSLSVTGSTQLSGSLKLLGLSSTAQSKVLSIDSNGNVYLMDTSSIAPPGTVIGSGSNKYIAVWSGSNYVTASKAIYEDNNKVGIGTTALSSAKLTISGGLVATGSNILSGGLQLTGIGTNNINYVLGIDNNQNVYYTSSAVLGVTPAGNDWDIQLKNGSNLSNAQLGSGSYHYNVGAWTLGIRGTGTIGSWSFATGTGSIASNKYASARGWETLASGEAASAEGWKTRATGNYSHAEGTLTTASKENSHAEGSNTFADGANSHAAGYFTVAAGDNQTVIGKYNTLNNTTDLFVIGNGSGTSTRSDLATFGTDIKLNASTFITGSSLTVSSSNMFIGGQVYFKSIQTGNYNRYLVIDSSDGKLYYTSSTGGGGGGSAITVINGNTGGQLTTNLTTLYITGSGVTPSSPSAGIVSMSIVGGGGTGTPGGSDTQVQYNNSNAFGGSPSFTWTNSSRTLYVSGTISASFYSASVNAGVVGYYGTASWAQSASVAISSSYVLSASYALSSSYALSASFASVAASTTAGGVNTTIQFNRLGVTTGSTNFTFITSSNTVNLTGSLIVTGSISSSLVYVSASGTNTTNVLQVYGSGSSSPLFSVNGSQGQLFTVTDLLSGSLFSVRDISGIPVLNVYSDNTVLMGNFNQPSLHTTAYATVNTGRTTMYTFSTSSYNGAVVDYYATSASVAFAGSINAIWIPGQNLLSYTSSSIVTIGSPVGFGFLLSASLSGSGVALIQTSASSDSWSTKLIIKSI